jgi:hypothetical protein
MNMTGGKRSGRDDTSKNRVVIQIVILEVGGRSSYHALTKINYSVWMLPMKVQLKARALRSVIEDDDTDQQKEMIALDALCGTVPPEMLLTIVKKETTKEAWDVIATMRIGGPREESRKFDLTTFDDGETVEDYVLCLSSMKALLTMLHEEVKDRGIIAKMLRSLLPHFKQIMIVIKTLLNVSTMSDADLTGRLKEAEETFEEVPTSLQQDEKLYLTEEEWDAWRNKRKVGNHSGSGARGGGIGDDRGRGSSSSSGSSSKPTGDECRSKPKKEQVRWRSNRASQGSPAARRVFYRNFDSGIRGGGGDPSGEDVCPP